MKRLLQAAALVALLVAAVPGWAQHPEKLVRETTEQVLSVLEERQAELKENPQAVYTIVNEIVLPHFDFELMSRYVLARHWRAASPEQQQRFVEEFRDLLVRTYATSLAEYSGQSVEFKPMVGDVERGRVTARTIIEQGSGPDIPVDYNLRRTDAGWKVFDVVIDGVSLIQNYRGSFGSEIRRNGMDALLQGLSRRNQAKRGE